jgi:transposase
MEWTQEQYDRIAHLLPTQRGNVEIENLTFFRALQYITENGCKWRKLPEHFGKWNSIYRRFRRWIDKGIFDRIEEHLQMQVIDREELTALAMDSSYIKVHPNGMGAPKKKGPQSIGKSRGGWTTKIHSVVADVKLPIKRRLSPGSAADDPVGQQLMEEIPKTIRKGKWLLMDKAYEGDDCRTKAKKCGMRPVVPPKSNRKEPWKYSKKLYKRRNMVERNFRFIKEFRRVYTRYDKLDETYNAFIAFANINIFMRN